MYGAFCVIKFVHIYYLLRFINFDILIMYYIFCIPHNIQSGNLVVQNIICFYKINFEDHYFFLSNLIQCNTKYNSLQIKKRDFLKTLISFQKIVCKMYILLIEWKRLKKDNFYISFSYLFHYLGEDFLIQLDIWYIY